MLGVDEVSKGLVLSFFELDVVISVSSMRVLLLKHLRESCLVNWHSFLRSLPKIQNAENIAKQILDAIGLCINLSGYEVVVTPRIGSAIFPHHGDDLDSQLKNVDAACITLNMQVRMGTNYSLSR